MATTELINHIMEKNELEVELGLHYHSAIEIIANHASPLDLREAFNELDSEIRFQEYLHQSYSDDLRYFPEYYMPPILEVKAEVYRLLGKEDDAKECEHQALKWQSLR